MQSEHGRRGQAALMVILAAGILSTGIHYTHNFVAVNRYPGPADLYTATRVAILVSWPLLTWIGLIGYRRFGERRDREARICLAVYSLTGLATLGHFVFGDPNVPTLFYATLFTDALTAMAVVGFVVWSVGVSRPRAGSLGV